MDRTAPIEGEPVDVYSSRSPRYPNTPWATSHRQIVRGGQTKNITVTLINNRTPTSRRAALMG